MPGQAEVRSRGTLKFMFKLGHDPVGGFIGGFDREVGELDVYFRYFVLRGCVGWF